MKKEINIAEILKNKPHGIRLYSPIFGECVFCYIHIVTDDICVKHNGEKEFFSSEGLYNTLGEVMLFPSKSMQDWSKFSWKRGDILVSNDGGTKVIFDKWYDDTYTNFYCMHYLDSEDENNIKYNEAFLCTTERYSLEDKDVAQTYINTIEKRLGNKLNMETLEIEKTESFKDGDIITFKDRIILIYSSTMEVSPKRTEIYYHACLKEGELTVNEYLMSYGFGEGWCSSTEKEKRQLFDALAKEGKAWDAEKKEFVDLKTKWTPKPFDRVITRNTADDVWTANIFSHMDSHGEYVTIACVGGYTHCLPYNEETAKLIGTTKDVEG